MANKKQVLDKIARNLDQLGIANSRGSANEVVIDNGSNDLTISYVDASIQSPMGGVDSNASPFLGMGIAAPGVIKLKFQATSIAACLDTAKVIQALAVCAGHANDLLIEDSAGSPNQVRIRGQVDLLMMGE
jgi:hypothetical protein